MFFTAAANILIIPSLLLLFLQSPVKNFKKEYVDIKIEGKTYHFEVANTLYKKSKGLMFTPINKKDGMVFYYENKRPSFYNANVRFNLRVYWVSGNKITQSSIFEKGSAKIHSPESPIDIVIEIPLLPDASNDPGVLDGKNIQVLYNL